MSRPPRLPPLRDGDLDAETIAALGPSLQMSSAGLGGPVAVMARAPKIGPLINEAAAFWWHKSGIDIRLQELTILVNAKFWSCDYEWWVHARKAQTVGIPRSVVEDIRAGREPQGLKPDEQAVYDLVSQIFRDKRVDDETYDRAKAVLGQEQLILVVGFAGQYALLAMLLNVTETGAPPGHEDTLAYL